MNTLFLLLTGFVLLLMSQRYWARVLDAFVFTPIDRGNPDRGAGAAPGSFDTRFTLDIAASGGVLAMIGIGLSLAWGWAPIYAWLLLGCALLSGLLKGALVWIKSVSVDTTASGALDAVAAVCGAGFAMVLRIALILSLLVWTPFLVAMLVHVVTHYPAAALCIVLQGLLALGLRRPLTGRVGSGGVVFILAVGVGVVPAAIVLVQHLASMGVFMAAPEVAHELALGAGIILFGFVVARTRREHFLAPLGVLVSVALLLVILLAMGTIIIERPEVGYLDYFRLEPGPGAMPLVVVCAGIGILPLLGVIGDAREARGKPLSLTGPTFEGLLALVLLCAFLAAPGTLGAVPIELPDWRFGIDAGATTEYAIMSVSALGAGLPIPEGMRLSGVAAMLGGLMLVLIMNSVITLRTLTPHRFLRVGPADLRIDLLLLIMLGAVSAFHLLERNVPVDAWLAAGQLGLLFCALVLWAACFTAKRLRGDARVSLVCATILSALFWSACLLQVVDSLLDSRWATLGAQLLVGGLGVAGHLLIAANFERLASLRRKY